MLTCVLGVSREWGLLASNAQMRCCGVVPLDKVEEKRTLIPVLFEIDTSFLYVGSLNGLEKFKYGCPTFLDGVGSYLSSCFIFIDYLHIFFYHKVVPSNLEAGIECVIVTLLVS